MERLHHVEFAVSCGESYLKRFTKQYGFSLIAHRATKHKNQWVIQSGKATVILSEFASNHLENSYATPDCQSNDPYFQLSSDNDIFSNKLETVFNVAVKVKDVKGAIINAKEAGAIVLQEPSVIKDHRGAIEIGVIKSCIGNVIHTLIDDRRFSGQFLPLYADVSVCKNEDHESRNPMVTHMDHIAFVCARGSTASILKWYESCFKMHRFFINRYRIFSLQQSY